MHEGWVSKRMLRQRGNPGAAGGSSGAATVLAERRGWNLPKSCDTASYNTAKSPSTEDYI